MYGKSPASATSRRAIEPRLKRTFSREPSSLDGADRGGGGLRGRFGWLGAPPGSCPFDDPLISFVRNVCRAR